MPRMHRWTAALASVALVASSVALSTPAQAAPDDDERVGAQTANLEDGLTARFIVKLDDERMTTQKHDRDAKSKVGKSAQAKGRQVKDMRRLATGAHVFKLNKGLAKKDATTFMKDLAKQPGVLYVEPDVRLKPVYTPNDPKYSDQWHYHASYGINLPAALEIADGSGVTVGVIDTGITYHSDLNDNQVSGYDFISDSSVARDGNGRDSDPSDEGDWVEGNDSDCGDGKFYASSWHGTHVAGTIAAETNNSLGVSGVAGKAKFFAARALGRCGGYTSDIVDAMSWSAGLSVPGVPTNTHPAQVLNLSLGGPGTCSTTQQNVINNIRAAGTTVVVAAGNSSKNVSGFNPANCSGVIAVAASDPRGSMSYFSNYGSLIDITAPGGDIKNYSNGGILSTVNSGTRYPSTGTYGTMQGTSMAAPHIAGIVALMYSANPNITPAEVESTLKSTARSMPGSCPLGCGAGLVDAPAAVAAVAGTPTPDPTPDPTPNPSTGLVNGSFEQGEYGWEADSNIITNDSSYAASDGSWRAMMNGFGYSNTKRLQQKVTLGKSSYKLAFDLMVRSNETTKYTKYDTLKVQIIDSSGYKTTLATYSNLDKSDYYSYKTVDISRWAGQTVTIRFEGAEDSSVATLFNIDDIYLI